MCLPPVEDPLKSFRFIPLCVIPLPSVQCGLFGQSLDYKGRHEQADSGPLGGVGSFRAANAFANVVRGPPDYSGINGSVLHLIALILGVRRIRHTFQEELTYSPDGSA